MRQSWRFSVFSAENMPVQFHIQKLMEKLAGAPFGVGKTKRIPFEELGEWCDELSKCVRFITHDSSPTMGDLLKCAEKWLLAEGDHKRGLIIDPWNQLDHYRGLGMNETEFIRDTLNRVRNWARQHDVHVWIVAHPQKVPRTDGKLPTPRPDMISGSQHWWNIADCAIAIWRDPDKAGGHSVEVVVQKIRFKHIGLPGNVSLDYDIVTGRYSEPRSGDLYSVATGGE
jgi:twinkle protein